MITRRFLVLSLLCAVLLHLILVLGALHLAYLRFGPEQATRIVATFNRDRGLAKAQKYFRLLDQRIDVLEGHAANLNATADAATVCTESLMTALSERSGFRKNTADDLDDIKRTLAAHGDALALLAARCGATGMP